MDSPNVALVRAGYEAFNRRDYDAVLSLLDAHIEYRPPMDPLGVRPVFHGRDEVRQFHEMLAAAFEEYRADVRALTDGGEVVTATGRIVARTRANPDHVAEYGFSHFWRIRDGRAVEVAFHDAMNPFDVLDAEGEGGTAPG